MSEINVQQALLEGTESDVFVEALMTHFKKHGAKALTQLCLDSPKDYLTLIYSILESRELAFDISDVELTEPLKQRIEATH
jgi:hypothetical protein